MTPVDQAVAVMEQAKREILSLRATNADLLTALEDLIEAIPRQTSDCDWWPDELTRAVAKARAISRTAEAA